MKKSGAPRRAERMKKEDRRGGPDPVVGGSSRRPKRMKEIVARFAWRNNVRVFMEQELMIKPMENMELFHSFWDF